MFLGAPGTGKTHLAVAALRGLIARGFEGIFYDFQSLLTRIHSGYDKASGSSDREAYQSALDAEILLLDDVGASRINDWVEDTVTSIVTHRCNSRKATIVTTNLRDPEAGDKRGSGLQEGYPQQVLSRGAHRDAGALAIVRNVQADSDAGRGRLPAEEALKAALRTP